MAQPTGRRTPLVRNNAAAWARFFATISLVPGVALFAGPLAVGFGIAGLRFNRKHPTLHGHRNSWIGIGAGLVLFLMTAAFAVKVGVASWREYRETHQPAPAAAEGPAASTSRPGPRMGTEP